jgi:hypothetical protein
VTNHKMGRFFFIATVVLELLTAGCPSPPASPTKPPPVQRSEPAVATLQVRYLDSQGWSPSIRDRFHYASQGSEIIPYDWFLALEEPHSSTLFKDDLKNYGFLFEPAEDDPEHLNPDNLPIGFAKHDESLTLNELKEAHWVGLTCAACHTGALTYRAKPTDTTDTTLILDGAPTSADFGAFIRDLAMAVQATNDDPQKLSAFCDRVVRAGHESPASDVAVRFKRFATQFAKIAQCATPTNPWGPGRVDAFGVIFDRVCDYDLPDTTDKLVPPDAPVSYPFLWYSNRQDHVQWHGEVDNHDWVHRLGRNTGEVLGVFARIDMKPGRSSYASSVDPEGLGRLDEYIDTLKPPVWPTDLFGALDPQKIDRGNKLFHDRARANCIGCHSDVPGPGQMVPIAPTPLNGLNTDDTMTVRVHSRVSPTAKLADTRKFLVVGEKFGKDAPAGEILGNAGAGALLGKKFAVTAAYIHWLTSRHPSGNQAVAADAHTVAVAKSQAAAVVTDSAIATSYRAADPSVTNTVPNTGVDRNRVGYEARPLAGIWATSPYLHNGSVPNLAQLLLLEPRQQKFYVGSLAFDPVKAGYVSDGSRGGVVFDTIPTGNGDGGHMYGVDLTPAEKQELIEYLKSL